MKTVTTAIAFGTEGVTMIIFFAQTDIHADQHGSANLATGEISMPLTKALSALEPKSLLAFGPCGSSQNWRCTFGCR